MYTVPLFYVIDFVYHRTANDLFFKTDHIHTRCRLRPIPLILVSIMVRVSVFILISHVCIPHFRLQLNLMVTISTSFHL